MSSFASSYIPTPATFTSRSTTATYYDANGVIQTAGIDVARDDAYFPDENGVMRPAGLLLEAAGTNLVTYSEQFDNSAWRKTSSSITANAAAGPDGTTTADLLYPNSTGSIRYMNVFTSISSSITTMSFFVKASGFTRCYLVGGTTSVAAWFDLSTGTIGTVASGCTASIQKLSNGWFRCSLTQPATTIPYASIGPCDADNSFVATASGTNGILIWGAQLEESPYPTSYIPTTSSTVTRAADVSSSSTVTRSADVAQITGSNFSSWYNQSEGTVYCSFLAPTRGTGSSSYQVASINNGTVNEHIGLSRSFDPVQIDANVVTGHITQAFFRIYPIPVGNQKIALTYKSNYSNLAASGTLSSADTNLIVPNPTQLSIGQKTQYTTYGLNSTISRLTYYPQRLQDSTLQKLTS